jgi:putative membrane protein
MFNGGMNMMGGGFGMGVSHLLFWLFWVVLIILILWGVKIALFGGRNGRRNDEALQALKERYAKGEIERDDYLQRKRDLSE